MCFDVILPDAPPVDLCDDHAHTEPMPPELAAEWGLTWAPGDTITRWHRHSHDDAHRSQPMHDEDRP